MLVLGRYDQRCLDAAIPLIKKIAFSCLCRGRPQALSGTHCILQSVLNDWPAIWHRLNEKLFWGRTVFQYELQSALGRDFLETDWS